jgi:hypothetical protein
MKKLERDHVLESFLHIADETLSTPAGPTLGTTPSHSKAVEERLPYSRWDDGSAIESRRRKAPKPLLHQRDTTAEVDFF